MWMTCIGAWGHQGIWAAAGYLGIPRDPYARDGRQVTGALSPVRLTPARCEGFRVTLACSPPAWPGHPGRRITGRALPANGPGLDSRLQPRMHACHLG